MRSAGELNFDVLVFTHRQQIREEIENPCPALDIAGSMGQVNEHRGGTVDWQAVHFLLGETRLVPYHAVLALERPGHAQTGGDRHLMRIGRPIRDVVKPESRAKRDGNRQIVSGEESPERQERICVRDGAGAISGRELPHSRDLCLQEPSFLREPVGHNSGRCTDVERLSEVSDSLQRDGLRAFKLKLFEQRGERRGD